MARGADKARRQATKTGSTLAKAAEAMGVAVGRAMNALESTMSRRTHRPNGYMRLRERQAAEPKAATASDKRGKAGRTRKPAARSAGRRRAPSRRSPRR